VPNKNMRKRDHSFNSQEGAMKALAYLVGLAATVVVLLVYFSPRAAAQPEQTFQCIIEEESPTAIQIGGKYIPARDTFHVLVVFAEFPDDVFDTTNVNWPKYPLAGIYPGPAYLNTFIDSLMSQNSQSGNMSHYFRDMSMGAFKVTGKAYHVVTPQTRQWYYSNGNSGHGRVNRDVLLKLDSTISFSPFEKWIRGTNYIHTPGQDNIVDMIFMLYRSATEDGLLINPPFDFAGGQADLGFVGDIWVDNNSRRIQTGTVQSGFTAVVAHNADGRTLNLPPYRVSIHEMAHFFFPASNNWHNGGGFWAMLNDWAFRHNDMRQSVANSFERERVGWIYPDSVGPGPGQYLNLTLTDYATTGSALKIKVPSSNPNEYFRVEYHLRVSEFDVPEMHDPTAKGLYIIHQADTTAPFDQIRLLPADGRWTWVSDEVVYPSYYPSGLAVYRKSGVDRVDGYDDSRLVPFTWIGPPPSPNVPNPSWIHFHRDRQTNQLIEQTIFRGDGGDAWSLANNNVFTPWSNPNSQNQAKQKTWVAVEIANEIAGCGTIVLNVYIDSAACASLPPSKPQDAKFGYHSIGGGNSYPKLTWTANIEPDVNPSGYYRIERRLRELGSNWTPWTEIASVSGSTTQFIDNGITIGPTRGSDSLQYRMRAQDTQLKLSNYAEVPAVRCDLTINPPSKPFAGDILPTRFELEQNYPNPFNPTTTLDYAIPEDAHVSLRLFDLLGREVLTLVNEAQKAGRYSVPLDASQLASGVYIYRIQAAGFVNVKRMMLLK
jgi:hypothetical protein